MLLNTHKLQRIADSRERFANCTYIYTSRLLSAAGLHAAIVYYPLERSSHSFFLFPRIPRCARSACLSPCETRRASARRGSRALQRGRKGPLETDIRNAIRPLYGVAYSELGASENEMSRYGRARIAAFPRRSLQRGRRPWLVLTTDFWLAVSRQKFTATTGRRLLISTFFRFVIYYISSQFLSLSLLLSLSFSCIHLFSRSLLQPITIASALCPFLCSLSPVLFNSLILFVPSVSLSVFCRASSR